MHLSTGGNFKPEQDVGFKVDVPGPAAARQSLLLALAAAVLCGLFTESRCKAVLGQPQATPTEVHCFDDHRFWVNSVAFSPDGKVLAAATGNWDDTGEIKLWDPIAFKELVTLVEPSGDFTSLAFSPDGKILAAGGWEDNAVLLGDVATGRLRAKLGHHPGRVRSVAFSRDGKTLAVALGSPDNVIELWDAAKGQKKRTLSGHVQGIWSIAFSPWPNTLASCGNDATVRLWNVQSGKAKSIKGHEGLVGRVVFAPDGKTVASAGADKTIRLWDARTAKARQVLTGHTDEVFGLAFSPDGKVLASGSNDHSVRLWDAATGKHMRTLDGHQAEVMSVAFSPDGKLLASAGRDKTVRLWRLSEAARAQGQPRLPELKALDQFLGTWDEEVTSRPTGQKPKATKTVGLITNEWVLGRRFLLSKTRRPAGNPDFIQFWTYDVAKKTYRSWYFNALGQSAEWTDEWDEPTKTITGKSGATGFRKGRFLDKDTIVWTVVARAKSGNVVLDLQEKQTRCTAPVTHEAASTERGRPKSPEQKILEKFIGKWNAGTHLRPAEWTANEERTTGIVTNEWALNGWFVQQADVNNAAFIHMTTHDPATKRFRQWHFDSQGSAVELAGQWNADSNTLTWTGEWARGVVVVNEVHFLDNDTFGWKLKAKDRAGKVYLDMEGKLSRRKER